MKYIFAILLCLQMQFVNAQNVKDAKKLNYCTTIEEALKQSAKKHKPVFMNCYADWASPSVFMDSVVLADPDLVKFISQNFVPLRVDMVRTEQGKALAKQYDVRYYAHYLVLDKDGNVVHRIVGGNKPEEFKKYLVSALSDNTSLAGMTKQYENGKKSLDFLSEYAKVLDLAGDDKKYGEVTDKYLELVNPNDLFNRDSWNILINKGRKYESKWFNFIYDNRAKFASVVGNEVDEYIAKVASQEILPYMLLQKNYNQDAVNGIGKKIFDMKSSSKVCSQILAMCDILNLRQNKEYTKMLDIWTKVIPTIGSDMTESMFDQTLCSFRDMPDADKATAAEYLKKQAEGKQGTLLNQYNKSIDELANYSGINFETGSLQEALDKAKAEKKLFFVDCYTSWCGPCKMMSAKVFPSAEAGAFFNPRFVSIKIDMEKGEGIELMKKWEVTAFPTYIFLDAEGKVFYSTRGYLPPDELVKRAQEGLSELNK